MSEPFLKLGGVSAATGVSGPMLSRWLDRKTIKSSRRDTQTTGSGVHRGFSRNTVIQIAISKALIDLGLGAGTANRAATVFTEYGQPGRSACQLFEFGRTVLAISSDGSRVINCLFTDTLSDVCGRPPVPSIIVDLGQIINSTDQKLENK